MLRLTNVEKRYANGYVAIRGIGLSVDRGEILAIVGGSGCGKSTLLRLVAGLDNVSNGRVELDGTPVTGPRPEIGVVFQEPRLMPWLDISANIAFGLKGLSRAERASRVEDVLARVNLSGFARALPRQLSGGMAQRVAIARALVTRPEVLLLDEPFSALDALIRMELQDHLLDVWDAYAEDERPTLILVTHDIEEALALADRVVVLGGTPGRIHGDYHVGLPRRGRREHDSFPGWRARLLQELRNARHPGTVQPDYAI